MLTMKQDLDDGIVIYAARVPSNDHVLAKVCNLTGGARSRYARGFGRLATAVECPAP